MSILPGYRSKSLKGNDKTQTARQVPLVFNNTPTNKGCGTLRRMPTCRRVAS